MSTVTPPREKVSKPTTAPPTFTSPLVEGHRLDQPTFHARYEATPPGILIDANHDIAGFRKAAFAYAPVGQCPERFDL